MVHPLASLPHAGHLVLPGSIDVYRDWSKGIASDLALAEGARLSCGSDLNRSNPHALNTVKAHSHLDTRAHTTLSDTLSHSHSQSKKHPSPAEPVSPLGE